MIIIILLFLIIVSIASIIFLFSGFFLYDLFIKAENKYFKIALSYFLGLILFLGIYRLLSFISNNAFFSLIMSFIILIPFLYFKKNTIKLLTLNKREIFFLIIIGIFIFLFTLTFWIHPYKQEKINDYYINVGTLHTGRYANIATYIHDSNRVPRINQNYGQALLATIPMFFSFNKPFFALYLWFTFSMFFLILVVYGFLRTIGIEKKYSVFGTMILFFGTSSLSLAFIIFLDIGNSFLFLGQTDSIITVATFLGFIVWINKIYKDISRSDFLAALIFGFTWCIFAPQNIIFAFFIMSFIIVYGFLRKNKNYKKFSLVFIVFLIAVFIGIFFGGMLMPNSLIEKNIKIPGVMEVFLEGSKKISIVPILHFKVPSTNKSLQDSLYLYPELEKVYIKEVKINLNSLPGLFYWFETLTWDSFRIIFFPIIGFISLGFYLFYKKKENLNENFNLKLLYSISLVTLIIGFSIAYFFIIDGKKWALTRFLQPGIYLGLIFLVISMIYLFRNLKKKYVIIILSIFCLIIFTADIYKIIDDISINVFPGSGYIPFLQRIKIMIESSGIVGLPVS